MLLPVGLRSTIPSRAIKAIKSIKNLSERGVPRGLAAADRSERGARVHGLHVPVSRHNRCCIRTPPPRPKRGAAIRFGRRRSLPTPFRPQHRPAPTTTRSSPFSDPLRRSECVYEHSSGLVQSPARRAGAASGWDLRSARLLSTCGLQRIDPKDRIILR